MPRLSEAPINKLLRINKIHCDKKMCRRLQSLGFTKDALFTLMKNDNGDVIAILGAQKIAINAVVASKICVREVIDE